MLNERGNCAILFHVRVHWTVTLAAFALGVAGCQRAPSGPRDGHGVLLIAIDGLRPDHLPSGGYDRDTAPFLSSVMGASVGFEQAFSSAPFALGACVSLLTGCDATIAKRYIPSGVEMRPSLLWNIPRDAPRLAQEFLRAGYATAAFLDDPSLSKLAGFHGGFQHFSVPTQEAAQRRAGLAELAPRLENWVRSLGRRQNWFAVLHVSDLERAFANPDPIWNEYFEPRDSSGWVPPISDSNEVFFAVPKTRWTGAMHSLGKLEAIYDGAIRKLDSELERLLGLVLAGSRGAHTTLAIVGTHGMSLGESGLIAHHGRLCDVDLRVPLAIRPRQDIPFQPGTTRSALISLLDLAPTLLDMEGLLPPSRMQGRSFAGLLAQPSAATREMAFASHGFQAGWVALDERWCYESVRADRAKTNLLESSWLGSEDVPLFDPSRIHIVLHDRRENTDIGHLKAHVGDGEAARRLRAGIRAWEQDCESLRRALQSSDLIGGTDALDPLRMEFDRASKGAPGS